MRPTTGRLINLMKQRILTRKEQSAKSDALYSDLIGEAFINLLPALDQELGRNGEKFFAGPHLSAIDLVFYIEL